MNPPLRLNRNHCIAAILLLLTGCAKSVPPAATPFHLEIEDYPSALKLLESLPPKEPCDTGIFRTRHDLVGEVSRIKKELLSQTRRRNTPDRIRPNPDLIPFQGSFLVKASEDRSETPAAWKSMETSWGGIREDLDRNRTLPIEKRFALVNHRVQSLLMNDLFRSYHEVNLGINHDTVPRLSGIDEAVKRCLDTPACLAPRFDSDQQKAVTSIPLYARLVSEIGSATDEKGKRDGIQRFAERTRRDVQRYLYRGMAPVSRTREGPTTILKLPLHPGKIKEDESRSLEETIQGVWKNATTALEVEWTRTAPEFRLFKILFHIDEPGKRANTNPENLTINLYPGTRLRSVAHEVGHVLGFPDHYYTVWDGEKCSYTQYSIGDDLMSDSQTGIVTTEEWGELMNGLEKPRS